MNDDVEYRRGIDGVPFRARRRTAPGGTPAWLNERLQESLDQEGLGRSLHRLRIYQLEGGWWGLDEGLQEFMVLHEDDPTIWNACLGEPEFPSSIMTASGLDRVEDIP